MPAHQHKYVLGKTMGDKYVLDKTMDEIYEAWTKGPVYLCLSEIPGAPEQAVQILDIASSESGDIAFVFISGVEETEEVGFTPIIDSITFKTDEEYPYIRK